MRVLLPVLEPTAVLLTICSQVPISLLPLTSPPRFRRHGGQGTGSLGSHGVAGTNRVVLDSNERSLIAIIGVARSRSGGGRRNPGFAMRHPPGSGTPRSVKCLCAAN